MPRKKLLNGSLIKKQLRKKTYNLSKIGLKFLFCFLIIFSLSYIAFLMTITALNNTQNVQKDVVNKTLPLLAKTQQLSQSVFNYIVSLERLSSLSLTNNLKEKKTGNQKTRR